MPIARKNLLDNLGQRVVPRSGLLNLSNDHPFGHEFSPLCSIKAEATPRRARMTPLKAFVPLAHALPAGVVHKEILRT